MLIVLNQSRLKISKPLKICQGLQRLQSRVLPVVTVLCLTGRSHGSDLAWDRMSAKCQAQEERPGRGRLSHHLQATLLGPRPGQAAGEGTTGISFHLLHPAQAPGSQSPSESRTSSETSLLLSS